MFDTIETKLVEDGKASLLSPLQQGMFTFLSKAFLGADPKSDPKISESGVMMVDRWLALMLLPTIKIGILQPLEELFLHSFQYPFFLVSGDYKNIYNFIETHAKDVVTRGQSEFGLTKEETIHNLIFTFGFNAFGGFSLFLPSLINQITADKTGLQKRLREEVSRNITSKADLNFESLKNLPLVLSVVYETLRLSPPVPSQFARARKDFRLKSHEAEFEIKKGELLCGYQPLVMRDSRVFDDPETFKPDRFVGEKGSELLNYLYWSNGPQTGSPSESNKQCAGKDYVTFTAGLVLAYVFYRYESIVGGSGSFTAVEKAK